MKLLSEAQVAIVFERFQQFGEVERAVAEMREVFPCVGDSERRYVRGTRVRYI